MTVKLADIEGAREILKGVINPTPTIFDEKLSAELHARILFEGRVSAAIRIVQDSRRLQHHLAAFG
jgi:hypothetical protein